MENLTRFHNRLLQFFFLFILSSLVPLCPMIYEQENNQSTWQKVGGFLEEKSLFIQKFWQNYAEIGAIAPSSSYLADAMTQHIDQMSKNKPLILLEVGAGTGPFTEYIVQYMPQGSELHVVEIDQEFCKILEEKFGGMPNVYIHCCSILELTLSSKVDCIVSGLPFNAFSPNFVNQILQKYSTDFIKPGGIITFFEYAFLPTLKKIFIQSEEYQSVLDLLATFKSQKSGIQENIVMRNLPPARVITCIC